MSDSKNAAMLSPNTEDVKEKMDFQTTIRMSSAMWKAILDATEPSGVSAMEWIRRAIKASLDERNLCSRDELVSRVERLEKEVENLKRVGNSKSSDKL